MKRDLFSIRLAPALSAEVSREAQRRGLTRTAWAAHLIERGLMIEAFDGLVGSGRVPGVQVAAPRAGATEPTSMPPAIISRLLFAACFSEAILKKLNAVLNRNSSELGLVAAQARDQAEAESSALIASLHG